VSTKDQWFDLCKIVRRDQTGIDPLTRRPIFDNVVVLDNEPCDLSNVDRRVGVFGPSGTVYTTVTDIILKLFPDDSTTLPDENDEITVNGSRYKVLTRHDYRDGGSGAYRGSRLTLEQAGTDRM